jgi:hypothetical protein
MDLSPEEQLDAIFCSYITLYSQLRLEKEDLHANLSEGRMNMFTAAFNRPTLDLSWRVYAYREMLPRFTTRINVDQQVPNQVGIAIRSASVDLLDTQNEINNPIAEPTEEPTEEQADGMGLRRRKQKGNISPPFFLCSNTKYFHMNQFDCLFVRSG